MFHPLASNPLVMEILETFPGSKIVSITKVEKKMDTNMSFAPGPASAFASAFQAHIDGHMETASLEREQRDYLGGSRLGVECERALFYEYTHTPKDSDRNFKGKTLRVFNMGHDGEKRMAEYLRMAGFELLTERPDGKQFGFWIAPHPETGKARIAGHLDGVITKAPAIEFLPLPIYGPCLWENKELGAKSWNDVLKKGLQRSKPIYFVQMQIYMPYLGLTEHPGLFTAENRDTGELYAELIPFDAGVAQAASDKGARVISAGEAENLPRIATTSNDYRCKSMCDFPGTCWAKPDPVAGAVPARAWFQGENGEWK